MSPQPTKISGAENGGKGNDHGHHPEGYGQSEGHGQKTGEDSCEKRVWPRLSLTRQWQWQWLFRRGPLWTGEWGHRNDNGGGSGSGLITTRVKRVNAHLAEEEWYHICMDAYGVI
ncbi:hypothetical protein N7476_003615 [Penicillium atrosanguineum]|uniref:Uncharacterized protein n=1 Tax=Penicillium atrosanguineum TaxID=1132637 RepID=A0A9W9Q5K1_9EURO|nr:hypothetical protein N7476_003615 [Penicillium atrosanguineum]